MNIQQLNEHTPKNKNNDDKKQQQFLLHHISWKKPCILPEQPPSDRPLINVVYIASLLLMSKFSLQSLKRQLHWTATSTCNIRLYSGRNYIHIYIRVRVYAGEPVHA